MTTEKNEMVYVDTDTKFDVNGQAYNVQTGEIKQGEIVVQETADYKIVKLPNGDFKKNMKYHEFFSRKPETDEEKVELYKVFNDSDSELVTPLKNMVKKEINIKHVFIQPYQSFDEKTGNVTDGVTTTIQDTDGSYYATSSKSVYYTLKGMFQAFGNPSSENYKPLKVKVTGTARQHGVQIDLSLVGRVEDFEKQE